MDYAARMRKPITAISEEFMAALERHSWPGNVRELQNFIERSVILSKGAVLNGSLPELTYTNSSAPVTMEEAERSHILQTLQHTGGVLGGPNGAAARLGPAADDLDRQDEAAAYQWRADFSVVGASSSASP
jgi:formate hydrogenlyase transcriptional activator